MTPELQAVVDDLAAALAVNPHVLTIGVGIDDVIVVYLQRAATAASIPTEFRGYKVKPFLVGRPRPA